MSENHSYKNIKSREIYIQWCCNPIGGGIGASHSWVLSQTTQNRHCSLTQWYKVLLDTLGLLCFRAHFPWQGPPVSVTTAIGHWGAGREQRRRGGSSLSVVRVASRCAVQWAASASASPGTRDPLAWGQHCSGTLLKRPGVAVLCSWDHQSPLDTGLAFEVLF